MERREFNTPNFESEPCLAASIEDMDLNLFRSTLLPAMVDAVELGIGRSTLYRLLVKLKHKVQSSGGTRHTEWTVRED